MHLARAELCDLYVSAGVDRPLSPEQEALSVMMTHFIEDSLCYGLFYHRWLHPRVRHPPKLLLVSHICLPRLMQPPIRQVLFSALKKERLAS